jgi:hypothetical protein
MKWGNFTQICWPVQLLVKLARIMSTFCVSGHVQMQLVNRTSGQELFCTKAIESNKTHYGMRDN